VIAVHKQNESIEYWSTSNVGYLERLIDCLTARQHRKVNLCQLRGRETGSGCLERRLQSLSLHMKNGDYLASRMLHTLQQFMFIHIIKIWYISFYSSNDHGKSRGIIASEKSYAIIDTLCQFMLFHELRIIWGQFSQEWVRQCLHWTLITFLSQLNKQFIYRLSTYIMVIDMSHTLSFISRTIIVGEFNQFTELCTIISSPQKNSTSFLALIWSRNWSLPSNDYQIDNT